MRLSRKSSAAMAFACMLLTLPSTSLAQDSSPDVDDEAGFDEALSQFGYAAGVTHQCSEADAKDDVLAKSQHIYNRLTQLFGSDRAFFFAASFGAGSVDAIENDACEAYRMGFEDALKSQNLTFGDDR